jgi:hypothetical protein
MTDAEKAARAAGIREAADRLQSLIKEFRAEGATASVELLMLAMGRITQNDNAPAPAGVRVKPLVWYGKPDGQAQRIGRCGDIAYSVRYDMGAWGYKRHGESGLTVSYKGGRTFTDEADAINGADVDHEARIMDALESAPAGVTVQEAAKIADMVWAEYSDSSEKKWTFRKEHVENAIRRALSGDRT